MPNGFDTLGLQDMGLPQLTETEPITQQGLQEPSFGQSSFGPTVSSQQADQALQNMIRTQEAEERKKADKTARNDAIFGIINAIGAGLMGFGGQTDAAMQMISQFQSQRERRAAREAAKGEADLQREHEKSLQNIQASLQKDIVQLNAQLKEKSAETAREFEAGQADKDRELRESLIDKEIEARAELSANQIASNQGMEIARLRQAGATNRLNATLTMARAYQEAGVHPAASFGLAEMSMMSPEERAEMPVNERLLWSQEVQLAADQNVSASAVAAKYFENAAALDLQIAKNAANPVARQQLLAIKDSYAETTIAMHPQIRDQLEPMIRGNQEQGRVVATVGQDPMNEGAAGVINGVNEMFKITPRPRNSEEYVRLDPRVKRQVEESARQYVEMQAPRINTTDSSELKKIQEQLIRGFYEQTGLPASDRMTEIMGETIQEVTADQVDNIKVNEVINRSRERGFITDAEKQFLRRQGITSLNELRGVEGAEEFTPQPQPTRSSGRMF